MARPKTRSKPVSEKDAGEKSSTGDEVAELLDGAETPDTSEGGPVEAVASGAQGMPGSASDREGPGATVEAPGKKKAPKKDLRKLAPKKGTPQRRPAMAPARSAIETVVSRGIDPGDTKAIPTVELFRVTQGGRAMIDGRLCTIARNARVTRLTHDLKALKQQGIELELVGRT